MMKSVIICDDLAFVAKVSARLQRIGRRPDVGAGWTIRTLPTRSLKTAAIAERNLNDVTDAHLIIITARQAQYLPSRLGEWLERWAALRQFQDAALSVINDGIHDFTTVRNQVLLSLATDFENFSVFKPDARHEKSVNALFDQVIAWSGALKSLREKRA
jgi:hypothetical protein